METVNKLDNFPVGTVILSNLVSILIYVSGFIITFTFSWILSVIYLVFILSLEFRLLSTHCVNCYYWGKTCGFGKGRISSLFFKKGNPSKFCENNFTWKDMIPDFLISLIPLLAGIALLIIKFDLIILVAVVVLVALTTAGNGYIRSNLTCKYCKQSEIGCPAQKLFEKK